MTHRRSIHCTQRYTDTDKLDANQNISTFQFINNATVCRLVIITGTLCILTKVISVTKRRLKVLVILLLYFQPDTYTTWVNATVTEKPYEGMNLSLQCGIRSLGKPKTIHNYTWTRNGDELTDIERIKAKEDELRIDVSSLL